MTAGCECSAWSEYERIGLGIDTIPDEWYFPRFKTLVRRTPWIDLVACVNCGQKWYAGLDTRDDWYYFFRLSEEAVKSALAGAWPDVFDNMDALWPDQGWLRAFGFSSLEDWQQKNTVGT